jgi:hypothetical protein
MCVYVREGESEISMERQLELWFWEGKGKENEDIYPNILCSPVADVVVERTLECETSTMKPSSQTLPTE